MCVAASAAGVAVSQPIIAAQGGSLVHPAGARLTIPPGALPADAVVSLRDAGPARPGVDPALQTLSHHFVVSMRGVDRCTHATLILEPRDNVAGQPGGPIDRENLLIGAVDTHGQRKLFRPEVVTAGTGGTATTVDLCPKAGSFANFGTVAISAHVAGVHGVDYAGMPTILRVPYYSQDNLPWCVPTSLAMTMNQFDDLEGIVSNYQLAGSDGQGATDGNSYVGILDSMGVSSSIYSYVTWDADLIPSAPFNNYVKYVLSGNYPQYTRGLGMSSTTTSHAFVGVGANNQNIWLHDPSGAFAGTDDIAIKLTWAQFKATAIDETSSTELRTLYFNKPLRPANERTGSLVLAEGSGSSFVYKSDANVVLSTWQWDGSFWQNGYIWDDPLGILPQDGVFGNRFPRNGTTLPGKFAYKTSVANVTGAARTYEVWIFLENALGTVLESTVVNLDVPAYSWKGNVVSGELDDFVIASDGDYELSFELWEGGAWQDVKRVGFHVGTGPLAIP